MLLITLTPAAKEDLAAIACYTAKTWGKKQAFKYAELLDKSFQEIAVGKAVSKPILNHRDVYVCRCEHHYIFYLKIDKTKIPVILAVLHEHMDLMQRLKGRLPS